MLINAVSKADDEILYDLGTADSIRVGSGVRLLAVGVDAIIGTGSNKSLTILGEIRAGGQAIDFGDETTTGAALLIGAKGYVASSTIGGAAVELISDAFTVVNLGLVLGYYGFEVESGGGSTSTFENSGRIIGTFAGISREQSSDDMDGKFVLTNTGLIAGVEASYKSNSSSDDIDVILNRGTMRGDVGLEGGHDIYDGRGGRLIGGEVLGGNGNDRFLPGAWAEDMDGQGDFDTIDFRAGGAVRVDLMNEGFNRGRAAGDDYLAIERIFGSLRGKDILRGDDEDNSLSGFGGADTLSGRGGDDRITGGAGLDVLTGGTESDVFVFAARGDFGDRITDFQSNEPNGNDTIHIARAALRGSGLGTGFLDTEFLRISNNFNQAEVKADRFIFRQSDGTLWFDVDGRGGKGPVLVTNLQDGAICDAGNMGDIFIF
jgi:Ca2+-binding RTX toxin-like protein